MTNKKIFKTEKEYVLFLRNNEPDFKGSDEFLLNESWHLDEYDIDEKTGYIIFKGGNK